MSLIHKCTSNYARDFGWSELRILRGMTVWMVLRQKIAIFFVAASIEDLRAWTHAPKEYDETPVSELTVRQLYLHPTRVTQEKGMRVSIGPECAWPS